MTMAYSILFRLVIAAGLVGGGMLYLNHWKNALRTEGKERCEENVRQATDDLQRSHDAERRALLARISEMQSELNQRAQEAQLDSIMELDKALAKDGDLLNRPCLTEAINAAIGKRIRKR